MILPAPIFLDSISILMFHFLFFFIVNASEDNKDVKHNTNLITTLLGKRCYLGT